MSTFCKICRITVTIHLNCGPGLWRRVFYLNTSSQDQSCPGDWNVHTVSSVRGCAGAGESCRSAYSDEVHLQYSKVCGRAVGRSTTSPDGFHRTISGQTTVEGNYLDGVSVTHGAPGSRTHIWSFGAGHPGRCPCDSSNRNDAPLYSIYLLRKWERIISVLRLVLLVFGLELTAPLIIHAVPFTILHTSVHNFLHQLLTRLS